MSKKANPAVIGLFIVIGLALGVGGIVLFSSWTLFAKTERYILYFDASVRGLNPGAPVRFRGVTVGTVVETLIHHNQRPRDSHMPVIIEINQSLVSKKTDRTIDLSDEAAFDEMIKAGMRGVLESQSLLTGVLYVELDMLPDAAPQFHQVGHEYKEIPTVPTKIQALIENLTDLDFKKVLDQLNSTLIRLDTSLGELNVAEISSRLTNLLASVTQLAQLPDLTNSLASVHRTLDEFRLLSETVRTRINPLADGADRTLKEGQATLVELRHSLQTVRDLLGRNAVIQNDLAIMMDELADAARSVGALAEFLKRHPNALLSGRERPEPKP